MQSMNLIGENFISRPEHTYVKVQFGGDTGFSVCGGLVKTIILLLVQ